MRSTPTVIYQLEHGLQVELELEDTRSGEVLESGATTARGGRWRKSEYTKSSNLVGRTGVEALVHNIERFRVIV